MKAENYENIRTLLSNFLGSPILRLIKENQEKLEIDADVFDLVYEGFWDLYTFHAQLRDVSARKLQGWIQKIKLSSGPEKGTPVDEEAGEAEGEAEGEGEGEENKSEAASPTKKKLAVNLDEVDTFDQIAAVVRLKIPKVPLEPEMDDDGNEIIKEIDESELEDIPFEDKCL